MSLPSVEFENDDLSSKNFISSLKCKDIFQKSINSFLILVDEFESSSSVIIPPQATDAKTLERLSERSYVRDWQRLGLTNDASFGTKSQKHDLFRLTSVNAGYRTCRR